VVVDRPLFAEKIIRQTTGRYSLPSAITPVPALSQAPLEPEENDDDDTIILDRETALAIARQQRDLYRNQQANPFTTANQTTIFTAAPIATVSTTTPGSSDLATQTLDSIGSNSGTEYDSSSAAPEPQAQDNKTDRDNAADNISNISSTSPISLIQAEDEDLWGDLDRLVDDESDRSEQTDLTTTSDASLPDTAINENAIYTYQDKDRENDRPNNITNTSNTDSGDLFDGMGWDRDRLELTESTEPTEQSAPLDTIDNLFGDAFGAESSSNITSSENLDDANDLDSFAAQFNPTEQPVAPENTEDSLTSVQEPQPENQELDQFVATPETVETDITASDLFDSFDAIDAEDSDIATSSEPEAIDITTDTNDDQAASDSLENLFGKEDLFSDFGTVDTPPDSDSDATSAEGDLEPTDTEISPNITASDAPADLDSLDNFDNLDNLDSLGNDISNVEVDAFESAPSNQWQGIDAEIGDLDLPEDVDDSFLGWQTESDQAAREINTITTDQTNAADQREITNRTDLELDSSAPVTQVSDRQPDPKSPEPKSGKASSRTNFFAAYVNDSDNSQDDAQSSLTIAKQKANETSIVADTLLDLFEDLDASQDGDNAAAILESKLESKTDLVSVYLKETSIRLPIARLDEMNDLSEEIVVERNILEAQLRRLRELYQLLSQRINELDNSDTSVHVLYDKLSVMSNVNDLAPPLPGQTNPVFSSSDNLNNLNNLNSSGTNLTVSNPSNIDSPDRSSSVPSLNNPIDDASSASGNYIEDFDRLEMDRFGELHTLVANIIELIIKLEEVSEDINLSLSEAEQSAATVGKSFKQLQTKITQARMRPLSDIVGRFPRMLRSLSLQYGKQVELQVEGGDLLIDRAILEALTDPLNHLVRNAFDHGIENRQTRSEQGKPETGKISITAFSENNITTITIGDDGRGIDIDKIREKVRQAAIAAGMNADQVDAVPAEKLLMIIFEPGFTTTDRVTSLSGRGVGMDVVRTNLQQIGAEIKADTQLGVGTTFTITFTNTLASVQTLLIETNHMFMAMPTAIIKEIVPYQPEQLILSSPQPSNQGNEPEGDRHTFEWEGHPEAIPIIDLNDYLHFNRGLYDSHAQDKPFAKAPAVVVCEIGEEMVAIAVDCCWGEQDASIRQVESDIPLPRCFSGCIISGSGQAVPLLNPKEILNWLQPEPIEIEAEPESSEVITDQPADPNQLDQQGSQPQPTSQDQDRSDLQPATPETTPESDLTPPQPALKPNLRPNRVSVLVIDDSVNVRRYLALTLDKAGFYTEQAKDGEDALSKLRSGLVVDAIVSDIEMPRLDGYGLLANLRADSKYAQLPIVMLTSRSGDKHRSLAMNLGATEYFTKPYQEKTLVETLKRLTSAATEPES
jgi:CheY-like chemotaxis protein/signal transduction histidine kinase